MIPRPPEASGLTRTSTGLTEAHKQLIKLLAQRAVADYLAEVEAETATDQQDEVSR